jgi:glycosyltransferase involved in cell wall biosynthesis
MTLRLLTLAPGHPALAPGGTELMAQRLFRTLRERHGVSGVLLAAARRERHPGTLLQALDRADEMLVTLDGFDRFFLAQPDATGLLATLAPLVERVAPQVIHLHHPLYFGVETIDLLRRLAPHAALVLTLHDYFLLCPREGQLLTAEARLCAGPAADACRRCLPERSAVELALRALSLADACRGIDAFIAPSRFLRGRFLAAGWDAARLHLIPNGVPALPAAPAAAPARRDRFGFFGHLNRFKGALVALRASAALSAAGVAHRLRLHGEAARQDEAFAGELADALAAAPAARHAGRHPPEALPELLAECDWVLVPSIWWENAPLAILEARRHGRPVIASGIGGMAELVRDGIDGLHAPVNDPAGWAAVLRHAIETPGLWQRLAAAIAPPDDLEAVAAAHMRLYRELLNANSRVAIG